MHDDDDARAPRRTRGYLPGLDGLRALAVIAVLSYQLGATGGPRTLPGGFLGLEVFLVLSGFLITRLSLVERATSGRIGLLRFYLRRARRLLPAAYLMLVVVSVAVLVVAPGQAGLLRGDLPAALSHLTNWWLIWQQHGHLDSGPTALNHLWSLAVQEQFYLLWPLLLIAALRWCRWAVRLVVLTAAVAGSAVLMALTHGPWSDPSRSTYGTDTRAGALLLGALLAVAFGAGTFRPRSHTTGAALDAAGITVLGALVWAFLAVPDQASWLYQGGFSAVALAVTLLLAAVVRHRSRLGTALDVAPLRWLGARSYGLYLWHWPICALLPAGHGALQVTMTTALRLLLAFGLADASYRLVEKPVRDGALGRALAQVRGAWRGRDYGTVLYRLGAVAGALVIVTALGVEVARTPAAGAAWGNGPAGVNGPRDASTASGQDAPPSPAPSTGRPTPASTGRPASWRLPVSVGVFGDSQGRSLLQNRPAGLGGRLRLTDNTLDGCGILTDRVVSRSGERRDLAAACGDWLSTWTTRAGTLRPQLALVLLGAWEMFDARGPGPSMTFGTPAWDAHLTSALNRGIAALRDSGAQVALSLLPCYRPVRDSAGYWPERGDDSRTRHLNDLLRAAAAHDPAHVFTLEPPGEFCGAFATDRDQRGDGLHYARPGARSYFDAVVPQLLAIPAGNQR